MGKLLVSTCVALLAVQGGLAAEDQFSPQEAFFLRRMTEFWKDRDYALVKKQIEEFLATHSSSNIHEPLHAILADILYHEHDYQHALDIYKKITDAGLQTKTLVRKCQCLYLIGQYDDVIAILSSHIENQPSEETKFLLGDSLFRKMQLLSESNQQASLAAQAKPLLMSLYETSYRSKVLFPLAEVHRILGNHQEASTLFQQLSDQMPEKKEEILLQVAALQMNFDKNEAIKTYQQLVDLGKTKASEAAYNELVLLFHENRFEDLVNRSQVLSAHLTDAKKTLLYFCLGRSHFRLDHLPETIEYFEKFIQEETENTPYKRAAFLTLIHAAQKTFNSTLFDQVLEQFLTAFPNDEEAGKALLIHAKIALQEGHFDQAATDLQRLLVQFPHFPDKESLLYNHALLLSKTQKWSESRQAFLQFQEQFPSSTQIPATWPAIVQCSIQELREAAPEHQVEKKSQLAKDLGQALCKSDLFTVEERANYQYLLGQLLYDTKQYSESLSALETFSSNYPDHLSIPEALIIEAHLHRELASEPAIFVTAAEKALKVVQNQSNQTALRLQLFNSYLSIKEYDQAAQHLYHTYVIDETPIQQENALWLIHHFYEGAKKGDAQHHERATTLLKKVLMHDDNFALHFDPQQSYLEVEVLKLAELLPLTDKKKLLLSLLDFQAQHASESWKLQRQVMFELGKIHLSQNETDEALKVFDQLTASSDLTPSYFSSAALLEKSRILLSRCPECDKNASNPTIANILSTLKDLQIQKKLACEPLHLEAALEYADLRCSFAPPESRWETAIFFLGRIKEDFTAQDDPVRQEYHEARLRFPEKDLVFQAYMKCIDGEILSLEAQVAKAKGDHIHSQQCAQEATLLLEAVLKETTLTPFLKNRVESHLNQLKAL